MHTPGVANHGHVQTGQSGFVEFHEVAIEWQQPALCQLLRQHVPKRRAHRACIGVGQPGVAGTGPDQRRPATGKGFQIDVRANVFRPGVFQERRCAQLSHLFAAVETHNDGPIERCLARQRAQHFEDAGHASGVVGRTDRIHQRIEVRIEKNSVATLARQSPKHVGRPIHTRQRWHQPVNVGA